MIGGAYVTSITVVPETVASCVGNKAEEDTLLGVGLEFSLALTRRINLDKTAKSAKVGKVFLLSSCLKDTRGNLLGTPKDISKTEMMIECMRPKFDIKSSTFKKDRDMITN